MVVLMLGGTGYLGKHLAVSLAEQGNDIICLKRETSVLSENLINQERIHIYNLDCLESFLQDNAGKVDWFVNTACCYQKDGNDIEVLEANYVAPMKAILLCQKYGINRFMTMDTGLPSDFNMYSKTKAQVASFGKWIAKRADKGFTFVDILLENFYGEDEPKERFLHWVIENMKGNQPVALTEGNQRRDFVYIDDVIDTLIRILEIDNLRMYEEIPLGTGEGPTIREVIEFLHRECRSKSELLFGAVPKRKNEPDSVANTKRLEELGIELKYCWQNGMRKLL